MRKLSIKIARRVSKPRFVLSILLCLSGACLGTPPESVIDNHSYKIRSRNSHLVADKTADTVDRILAHYHSIFQVQAQDLPSLTIELGDLSEEYKAGDHPALYQSSTGRIRFLRKPDTMLLLHEIAHHFIVTYLGDIPVWLNEGVATYLGWSAIDADHLALGEIPVTHFRTLRMLCRSEKLMPLKEFLILGSSAFYEKSKSADHYSQAWGFVFFLLHGKMSRNQSFRESLDRIQSMSFDELVALEPDFHFFCRNFSAVQMMTERLDSGDPLRRLSNAFRLGIYQDSSSLDSLLLVAQNGRREEKLRIVALYAAAMIVVGPEGSMEKARLTAVLHRLIHRATPGLSRAAKGLLDDLSRGETAGIVTRFASLNNECTFYPAANFLVADGKDQG